MKGLLLAAGAFGLIVGGSMVLLRLYKGKKYYRVLLAAYAAATTAYCLAFAAWPADAGLLPAGWKEPSSAVDFANGLLVLTLLFHGFWNTSYAAALTGFSSNLMVLLWQNDGLTKEQLLAMYGAGGSQDPVLAWRLPNLLHGGYLEETPQGLRLLPRGRSVAKLTRFLQRTLLPGEAS